MKKLILIIIFVIAFSKSVYATSYLADEIESLGLEEYDTIINNNTYNIDFNFSNTVKDILFGNGIDFNIKNIINYILKAIFEEIFLNSKIIKNVVLIAFLSAFFKALTENFKNQGVAEIGFYTTYMVVSMLLISSFNVVVDILYNTIDNTSNIINGIMPMLAGLMLMSGASSSATIFSSFVLTSLSLLSFFLKNIFIPFLSGVVILNVINYITPKEVLNKLIDFLKWIIKFSLRSLALGLGFIISIQRIGAPILNSTINKTAKTFISFVPVVGDVMTGTVDSIMYFVGLLKSGIGIGVLIAILICFAIPTIKLISLICLYKITAILIEPISDNRITSCVDIMGEYTKLVLSSLIVFLVLLIFFVSIILTVSG